jgi:hypothetical protein
MSDNRHPSRVSRIEFGRPRGRIGRTPTRPKIYNEMALTPWQTTGAGLMLHGRFEIRRPGRRRPNRGVSPSNRPCDQRDGGYPGSAEHCGGGKGDVKGDGAGSGGCVQGSASVNSLSRHLSLEGMSAL